MELYITYLRPIHKINFIITGSVNQWSSIFSKVCYNNNNLSCYPGGDSIYKVDLRAYSLRPMGGGGGAYAPSFQTEIYKQQYVKWCLQDSHQPDLRLLATH